MPTRPLFLALALLGEPAQLDMEAIGKVYEEAQSHLEQKEYVAGAETFERLFDMVPEDAANRPIRESIALNVVHAWLEAYQNDVRAGPRDQRYLHEGIEFRQRYMAEFRAAYGDDEPIITELRTSFAKLDAKLDEEVEYHVCLSPIVHPCLTQCLQPIEPKRGCGGDGDPGLAAALLLPLGLRRRRDVLDRLADRLPADVVARLRSKLEDE